MKIIKYSIILILFNPYTVTADVLWVGSSPACSGGSGNTFTSYAAAEALAALNGTASDEIRLTRTIDYTGGLGSIQIGDEIGSTQITVVGGYDDCFSSQSGRTFVGNSTTSAFMLEFPVQSSTIVLKDLILAFNDDHGVTASGNVFLQLDNVDINNNDSSGLNVSGGATVEVHADSLIRFNDNINNPTGGGIRCTGNNSSVMLEADVHSNKAQRGGNIYLGDGCFMEILDGVRITGLNNEISADEGAGIYVESGANLLVSGEANRVIINNNYADSTGGGIYVTGNSSLAVLENTHFNNNRSRHASDIYATSFGQLTMGQTTACGQLFGCSEIQNSKYEISAVLAGTNSIITLNRTVIEKGTFTTVPSLGVKLVAAVSNGHINLNRVGIINNNVQGILGLEQSGSITASHLTVAGNTMNGFGPYAILQTGVSSSNIVVENSIFTDTIGAELIGSNGGSITGKCNLINNQTGWPFGTYHVGIANFINLPAGDARQIASSPGVDMCLQNTLGFSDDDIENQASPVNENTNPQGLPGEIGGLYDAGFDEVYDNIGEDEFLLTVQKEGSGEGVVISNPGGISCGSDCSEIYFNGTIVTLNANPFSGSEFVRWRNCPLVNQDDECLTNVQSSHTIRAVFEPDDLIFRNGFE